MIPWAAAMRDLRNDRARRAGIREERLRATAGVRGTLNLSSWRGRSGRRYVVGIHALSESETLEATDAVLIAVRRDEDGTARVVALAMAGPQPASGSKPRERVRRSWLARMRERGATELHVHRLAESEEERRAVMADLRDEAESVRPAPRRDAPEAGR